MARAQWGSRMCWLTVLAVAITLLVIILLSCIVNTVNNQTTTNNAMNSKIDEILDALTTQIDSNETIQLASGTECGESQLADPCNIKYLVTTTSTSSALPNTTFTNTYCRTQPLPTTTICSDACITSGLCTGFLSSDESGMNSRHSPYCKNANLTTCRGYCPTANSSDCPDLLLSPGLVGTVGPNGTFFFAKNCDVSICTYFFITNQSTITTIYGQYYWPFIDYIISGPGANTTYNQQSFNGDAADVCMSLINNNDAKKKCMIPTVRISSLSATCFFNFGCTTIDKSIP